MLLLLGRPHELLLITEGKGETWQGQERGREGGASHFTNQIAQELTITTKGETVTMIKFSPTRSLPQHVGILGATIQEEIWVRTQPNHIRDCSNVLYLIEFGVTHMYTFVKIR